MQKLLAQGGSLAWILATIGVNTVAFAGLLQGFGPAEVDWQGPFAAIGTLYDELAGAAYQPVAAWVESVAGVALPEWAVHAFVLYVSTASALTAGGTGLFTRASALEALKSGAVSVSWLPLIPAFIFDGSRLRKVSKFARDHSFLFSAYFLASALAYVGARALNAGLGG